jgi:NAD(P)-dependent dehydrogenase (short-subunit alcohol dehydrogenase family)
MTTIEASELLRPGLLQGVSIVLAGAQAASSEEEAAPSLGGEVGVACAALGAHVLELVLEGDALDSGGDEQALEAAADRLLADSAGKLDVLVLDGPGLFTRALAAADSDGRSAPARLALRACLETSWSVTHAFANRAFLREGCGGRIVYLLPRASGEHAGAARSGLENLARTLSIEWARHRITTVAVVPASGTPEEAASQVAALTAYLASPAGAYFSGCMLDLRGLDADRG